MEFDAAEATRANDWPVAEHWRVFIRSAVDARRYASALEVIEEGLRLVEARDAKYYSLKADIESAIADDIWVTPEEVRASLDATYEKLKAEGY